MSEKHIDYHADTSAISKSGLDLINKSPAHYYMEKFNNPLGRKPSKTLEFGTQTHKYFFEFDKIKDEYFIFDDTLVIQEIGGGNPRLTTKYKDWKKTLLKDNEGLSPITFQNYTTIQSMHEALMKHPEARVIMQNLNLFESRVDFEHEGVRCKMLLDGFSNKLNVIADLKTTDDASPEGFRRSVLKWRYYVQDTFYKIGLAQEFFCDPSDFTFVFLAVEKEPPFNVGVYILDANFYELGIKDIGRNLKDYKEALQSGVWKGYSDKIETLYLPDFKIKSLYYE